MIIPPCVEYHIPAKNFTLIKQLSRVETASLISAEFEGWPDTSIAYLTSVKQFRNLFESNNETGFLSNYYYSEATGVTTDFKNILDFKKQRLLKSDSGCLQGCIQKNGSMGKIELLPF